ncbi:MAG: TAXI family TRAP transporter solute-binding subunit [Thalassobaculales bacterium]
MRTIFGGLLAAALLLPLGAEAQVKQINMGGSTTTTPFFAYYSSIAATVTKRYPELNVTVISTGGFANNVRQMRAGQLQFGGVSPDLIADAENDPKDPYKDLRLLWWAVPAVQHIVVRADSPVKTVSDLDGKCFHAGMAGSSSETNMERIIDALGLKPRLHRSDAKDALNAIRNGRCLGQARTGSATRWDANTAEVHLTSPLKPVGYTPDEVAKVKKALPWMTFVTVPAGVIPDAPAYTTHALMVGFGATKNMDTDTAYKIVKASWEGIEEQRAAFAGIKGIDTPRQTVETAASFLHAGAIKYYREIGLTIRPELIPPEAR